MVNNKICIQSGFSNYLNIQYYIEKFKGFVAIKLVSIYG